MSQVYDEEEYVGGGVRVASIVRIQIQMAKIKKQVMKHVEHQLCDILYIVES